jgi:hypothetical protein
MSDLYIMRHGQVIKMGHSRKDILTWAAWYENAERHIGLDTIRDVKVSTVFLGLDHNFYGEGPPILWETAVFGKEDTDIAARYASKELALAGHKKICDELRTAYREKDVEQRLAKKAHVRVRGKKNV